MNDLNRQPARPAGSATPGDVSGVLETIASGLSTAIARPWLLLLPLMADLIAWLGVQVPARPLITGLQSLMIEQGGSNGPAAAEELGRIGDTMRVNDIVSSLTPSIISGLPNDSVLNAVMGALLPAATAGIDRSDMYHGWGNGLGDMIVPANGQTVIAWAALFFFIATILLAVFKAPIAHVVRGDSFSLRGLARDVMVGWLRILALVAIIIAGLGVVLIPLFLLALLVAIFGINLVALVSLALFVFGSVGALYVYFLLDAMFIYRVGPIQAAKMSFSVARFNFTETWRFAATSLLLICGVIQVWNLLIQNPPGLVVSFIANAVLGTGLSIASMMFFYDRARLPRPVLPSRTFDPLRRF